MEDNKNSNNKITPPVKPNLPSGVKFTNTVSNKPITKFEKTTERKNKTIVKQEKINKKTSTPMSKKLKIAAIVVSIILVLSALTSLVYFAFIKPSLPTKININFSVEFKFDYVNSGTAGTAEPKTVMPGDNVDLSYIISSQAEEGQNSGDVYIRITSYAVCDNNYYADFFSIYFKDNNWYKGNDGYYYYKGVLTPNTSIDSVKYIHISDAIGYEFAGKNVEVHIVAQALQAGTGAIETMWPTAPEEWSQIVK